MRVLVCGGRDYLAYDKVFDALEDLYMRNFDDSEDLVVIQGGAKGADYFAKLWALREFGHVSHVKHIEFPANWKKYGRGAGAVRNQQMIDEGKPDLVLAFPGGTGTADMVSRARKNNIKVIEIE